MLIEIEAVEPNARELRAIQRGWGAVHWACLLPTYAFLIGLLLFGLTATVMAGEAIPDGLFAAFLIGSWLLWILGKYHNQGVLADAHKKSPVGSLLWRWRIDETELFFDNGVQRNSVAWRGVKSVRDEKDRFVFLVSPNYNPVLPKRLLTEEQSTSLRGFVRNLDRADLPARC